MHHSTSGGSSETEVKELTVMPIWAACSDPAGSGAAVTTATPVGKQPKASRKARESMAVN